MLFSQTARFVATSVIGITLLTFGSDFANAHGTGPGPDPNTEEGRSCFLYCVDQLEGTCPSECPEGTEFNPVCEIFKTTQGPRVCQLTCDCTASASKKMPR